MSSIVVSCLIVACILCTKHEVSSADSAPNPASATCPLQDEIILERPLRIGAWNVQRLGRSKMKNREVVDAIVKVLLRYDIVVVQEIVDKSQAVPLALLARLNDAASPEPASEHESRFASPGGTRDPSRDVYQMAVSARLGTSSRYKEQYAYYYRRDKVVLNATFQYPDTENAFHIAPFAAIFQIPLSEVERIALIAVHIAPGDAVKEIDALVDVFHAVSTTFDIEDAIILGDLNAGCNYVRENDWPNIRLWRDARFDWLISNHVDTTARETSCPYDRIVVAGSSLKNALYEESAKPFYFHKEFDIGDESFIHAMSDHYPVEVLLRRHVPVGEAIKVEIGVTVEMKSTPAAVELLKEACLAVAAEGPGNRGPANHGPPEDEPQTPSTTKIMRLFYKLMGRNNKKQQPGKQEEQEEQEEQQEQQQQRQQEQQQQQLQLEEDEHDTEDLRCGRDPNVVRAETGFLLVNFHLRTMNDVMDVVDLLAANQSCVFTPQATSVFKYKLSHGVLTDASVYGKALPATGLTMRLLCFADVCHVSLARETSIA